ncbi:MAG: hypothetical protein LBP55_04485, partial [Candidatus Adiutrix sp.]|nr:hypothetical protein [Candidatus Adiutrix sp.]
MKKMQQVIIGGLISLALSLIGAITAHAQRLDAIYVAPKMIFSKQTGDMESTTWRRDGGVWSVLGGSDKDTNFGFGIALGNDFSYSTSYPVRVETEYVYHGLTEYSKGPASVPVLGSTISQHFKVKAHTLMVNGFFDIDLGSSFVPYVGGGLGA